MTRKCAHKDRKTVPVYTILVENQRKRSHVFLYALFAITFFLVYWPNQIHKQYLNRRFCTLQLLLRYQRLLESTSLGVESLYGTVGRLQYAYDIPTTQCRCGVRKFVRAYIGICSFAQYVQLKLNFFFLFLSLGQVLVWRKNVKVQIGL